MTSTKPEPDRRDLLAGALGGLALAATATPLAAQPANLQAGDGPRAVRAAYR